MCNEKVALQQQSGLQRPAHPDGRQAPLSRNSFDAQQVRELAMTSFSAAFSNDRSAYSRVSLLFSCSTSSLSRFMSKALSRHTWPSIYDTSQS